MQLFQFDPEVGFPIVQGDSANVVIARVARFEGQVQVGCFYLGAGGQVWRHPTTVPQLLLVVSGEGWVEGGDNVQTPVQVGQAAFWTADEEHATGTENGLSAVVIESGALDPAQFMPVLEH